MRPEAEKLLKQAAYELRVAESLLTSFLYAAASSHAQQAAEMALKALFVVRHDELNTEHKLFELAAKLDAPDTIRRAASQLTNAYMETRYFDARADEKVPAEEFTENDATEYFNQAAEVVEWVHSKLNEND